MCEVGKRRWQEEETHPVTTSETTANGDRALINSSHTHIHVHNEGKFVYRRHIAQPYISTVSHSDDFCIYKPPPGLLAKGKTFFFEDKHSEKICYCWWHDWNQLQTTWEYFRHQILWDSITSGATDECICSANNKGRCHSGMKTKISQRVLRTIWQLIKKRRAVNRLHGHWSFCCSADGLWWGGERWLSLSELPSSTQQEC